MATPRDMSRYFRTMIENSVNVQADQIIDVIKTAYPGANFICVTCDPSTVYHTRPIGYDRKYIWIQQTKNALNRNYVVKILQQAFPNIVVEKINVDGGGDAEERLASWGVFKKSHVHKCSPTETGVARTLEECNAEIVRLQQEIEELKRVSISNSHVNSHNTINVNNVNNIALNLTITPYGLENRSHISQEDYEKSISESVTEGLARLTCEMIEKIHSIDENKNFYMEHPHDTNVWVHNKGGIYDQISLDQFSKDAPLHYAEIAKSACRPMRQTVIDMTKEWVADHNRKHKNNTIMRTVQETALGALQPASSLIGK